MSFAVDIFVFVYGLLCFAVLWVFAWWMFSFICFDMEEMKPFNLLLKALDDEVVIGEVQANKYSLVCLLAESCIQMKELRGFG